MDQFLQKTDGSGNTIYLVVLTVTSRFLILSDGSNDTFNTGETLTFTAGEGTDCALSSLGEQVNYILVILLQENLHLQVMLGSIICSADFAVSGAGE